MLGIAFGHVSDHPRARRAAAPIVEFLRAIPPPALLPFAILIEIGVGASMKIFIIAFVCLWPVLLNTIDGVAGVDLTLRETARASGIQRRPAQKCCRAAHHQIFAGITRSSSLALILMVITEMVSSTTASALRPGVAAAI